MDEIIKEELWRTIGTFGLAFIFLLPVTSILIRKYPDKPLLIILGLPLVIAIFVFLILIFVRKKLAKINYKSKIRQEFKDIIYVILFGIFDYFVLKWNIFRVIFGMLLLFILLSGFRAYYRRKNLLKNKDIKKNKNR